MISKQHGAVQHSPQHDQQDGPRFKSASTRTTWQSPRLWWGVFALLVIIAAGILFQHAAVHRAHAARTRHVAAAPSTMPDMPGMSSPSTEMSMPSDGGVNLSPAQMRGFGITFATAAIRSLIAETRTTGIVTVDERRITQVTPRVDGFAERVYADFIGRAVSREAPLIELYSPAIVAAEQELLLAKQLQDEEGEDALPGALRDTASLGTNLVSAARQRLLWWNVPADQVDEVLRTRRVRRTITLRSPTSGVIVQKSVVQGQGITANVPLYTIADLSTVWVDAQLREADADVVRIGSRVMLSFPAYPGRHFAGIVSYISPIVDTTTRVIQARITVANTVGLLKPGMYATVQLSTPTRSALTVPSSAVLRTGERNIVFVDVARGRLVPRTVETGRTAGDLTEILAGIQSGERVVTSAQYLLDSESNLGDVMRSMLSQMGTSGLGGPQGMQDMPGMQNTPGAQSTPAMQNTPAMPGMSPLRER